ncbi:hypothetical protein E1A91_D06G117000v1 [Gossypium mustelinum]|uniref:Uncharacterized protein n=1 Tax=Gossypium mustelinum TaxID=34275 RepID=A0A5D2UHE7_GOSMU|nr:hypothetical protein E1A91_D06G117000v1 [Gossypium mustelinum]TYI77019.1 hypothetical protein E1A91_D06G117000v1 [Gossypium mustelinum]
MASASYSPHLLPFPSTQKPRTIFSCTACNSKVFPYHGAFRDCSAAKLQSVIKAKAAPSNRNTKPNSVICGDCDGNGKLIINLLLLLHGKFSCCCPCWCSCLLSMQRQWIQPC